jgi:hypothetical protein
MTRVKSIGPRLTDLAVKILDQVSNAPLDKQLEAFKLLTAFHVGTTRAQKGLPEEDTGDSIASLRERVANAQLDGFTKDTWKARQLDGATNDRELLNGDAE